MAAGRGRGRNGCKQLLCGDSMIWVWSVILAMVLAVFILVAATGRGKVDIHDVDGLGGGPWWAWMIGVVAMLFIFVIVYMISMQYAEPVLAFKMARDEDPEAGMPLTKTSEKSNI